MLHGKNKIWIFVSFMCLSNCTPILHREIMREVFYIIFFLFNIRILGIYSTCPDYLTPTKNLIFTKISLQVHPFPVLFIGISNQEF